MRYQADVTETVYRYDGSFSGFLCCVFESYAHKEIPAAILGPDNAQLTLFAVREILTDADRAKRVAASLERLGPAVKDRVATAFLSCEEEKDLILLRFLRVCFAHGGRAVQMTGDPEVAAAFALERNVNNEACRMTEFVRFEERDGMLGAVIHPQNRVLPLLQNHFCNRLPEENFLIYDANHGMALLQRGGRAQYLQMERYMPGPQAEEKDWQLLWKRFFKALTIEERRNEKAQMQHVPKRYWQDMPEMQKDLP